MNAFETYQSVVQSVCELDRYVIIQRLTHFNADMPLDFTAEYLDACTTDQLRHLLVAALWRWHQRASYVARAS